MTASAPATMDASHFASPIGAAVDGDHDRHEQGRAEHGVEDAQRADDGRRDERDENAEGAAGHGGQPSHAEHLRVGAPPGLMKRR